MTGWEVSKLNVYLTAAIQIDHQNNVEVNLFVRFKEINNSNNQVHTCVHQSQTQGPIKNNLSPLDILN